MTTDTLATVDDTELGQLRRACASYVEVVAARDAEIKRLGDAVKFLNSFRPDAELAKRDAEIERLRHEVTLREQICADATLYARRLQEADDEIERLRELLREAHLALSFMRDPTRKLLDLRYRVRDALGE